MRLFKMTLNLKCINRLLAVFIVAVTASCRSMVFEDRVDCPKYLFLDVLNETRFDSNEKVSVGVAWDRNSEVSVKDTTTLVDIREHRFYISGRRGVDVSVCGVVGFGGGMLNDGSSWTVREGREFPKLFRFVGNVKDPEEGIEIPVELRKEYCDIAVCFSGYKEKDVREGLSPFTVSVRGNSCGIDAMTGIPVLGQYSFQPIEREEGIFRFRVPRQLDEWLSMKVGLKDGVTGYNTVVKDISLWNQFRLLGNITWEEKNLPDIILSIDVTNPTYRITIVSWDEADGIDTEFGKGLEYNIDL